MILVTRLNGRAFVLNSDLIETIEPTPDTVITLTNGAKYIVSESVEVILERIAGFRARAKPLVVGGAEEDEEAPPEA